MPLEEEGSVDALLPLGLWCGRSRIVPTREVGCAVCSEVFSSFGIDRARSSGCRSKRTWASRVTKPENQRCCVPSEAAQTDPALPSPSPSTLLSAHHPSQAQFSAEAHG